VREVADAARAARPASENPKIGARLFISARTVQYHLGKVFASSVSSPRSQLDRVLPADPAASRPG
jgi:DNA-binding NarL/FixJ family response regulator